jgi:hypothetical protein
MTVDSFLNGDFMDAVDDEEDEEVYFIYPSMVFWCLNFILQAQSNEDLDTEGDMESDDDDDDGSFGSIDDLDGTSPFISQL